MTSDNERRAYESLRALERGDVEALVAEAHPDVTFVNPPYALERGTRHGAEGFRTGMQNMLDAFDELRFDPERMIDLGDRVVGIGTWTGRGRESSYRFEPAPFAFLVTLEDGLIIRYEWFAEHAEALRAAGLDPDGDAGSPDASA